MSVLGGERLQSVLGFTVKESGPVLKRIFHIEVRNYRDWN